MDAVIDSILPVFALIILGKILQHYRFFKDEFFKQANDLVYYMALPSLLFVSAAGANPKQILASLKFSVVLIATASACAGLALLLGKLLKLNRSACATGAHVAFRGNLAYAGMPVVFLLFSSLAYTESDLARAVIMILPVIIFYNLLGLILAMRGDESKEKLSAIKLLVQILKNPLIISSLAGLVFACFKFPIPTFAHSTLKSLGAMSFPLVLLALGASLSFTQSRKILREAMSFSMMKCLVSPLIAAAFLSLIQSSESDRCALLIYAACPSAVSSYIFTTKYNGWRELNSAVVVLSTLISLPVMAMLIYIL
jgi:predicted permease